MCVEKKVRDRERFTYFKELAHTVIKASKFEISREV